MVARLRSDKSSANGDDDGLEMSETHDKPVEGTSEGPRMTLMAVLEREWNLRVASERRINFDQART